MVYPSVLLAPGRSRDPAGPITPTITGDVRVVTVDGAPAWRVIEGTTNYAANPRLASGSTSWSQYSGGGIRTAVSIVDPRSGESISWAWAKDVSTGNNAGALVSVSGSYTTGTMYTISMLAWATGDAVGKASSLNLRQRDPSSNETTIAYTNFTWSATPTLISVSGAITADVPYLVGLVGSTSGASTGMIYMTAGQIELKAYATPLCPALDEFGALIPGNQWNGTPNASTSTRTSGLVSAPMAAFPANLYVAYTEGGAVQRVVLASAGAIGTYGNAAFTSGALRLTSARDTTIVAALAYDRALTPAEILQLNRTPAARLGWTSLASNSYWRQALMLP